MSHVDWLESMRAKSWSSAPNTRVPPIARRTASGPMLHSTAAFVIAGGCSGAGTVTEEALVPALGSTVTCSSSSLWIQRHLKGAAGCSGAAGLGLASEAGFASDEPAAPTAAAVFAAARWLSNEKRNGRSEHTYRCEPLESIAAESGTEKPASRLCRRTVHGPFAAAVINAQHTYFHTNILHYKLNQSFIQQIILFINSYREQKHTRGKREPLE